MQLVPNIPVYKQFVRLFEKETGLLAPGKDAPVAAGNDPHYDITYRQREWDRWLRRQTLKNKIDKLFTDYAVSFEVDGRYSPKQYVEGVMSLLDEELNKKD